MSFAIAAFLRPFALFFILACVLLPIRYAVIKWLPEGKLKKLLLTRVDVPEKQPPGSPTPREKSSNNL